MKQEDNFNIMNYLNEISYIIFGDNGEIQKYSSKEVLTIYKNLLGNSLLIKDNNSSDIEYYIKDTNKFYELITKKLGNGNTLKIIKDITKYKIRERSLQIDKTTGLPNKDLTDDLLNNYILESKEKNEEFSVLFCDIDFFKQVNDIYGHDAGDTTLGLVGQIFRTNTRQKNNQSFKVRPLDITGRHGGEEFLIVLSNINLENTFKKAEEIRQFISATPVYCENERINVTISIGFHHVSFSELQEIDDIDDFRSQIMKKADLAMYEAKKEGRNKVVKYTKGVTQKKELILK